jgi:hypothetical protein
MDESH